MEKSKKYNIGFTLIELILVIGILGLLAAGLLAALDPLEQLKKGRDTATREATAEVYNAMIRFYANVEKFPWTTSTLAVANLSAGVTQRSSVSDVISAGELRSDFLEVTPDTRLSKIYMSMPASGSLRVCYMPESKSLQKNDNTVWTNAGASGSNCAGSGGVSYSCYWCVK